MAFVYYLNIDYVPFIPLLVCWLLHIAAFMKKHHRGGVMGERLVAVQLTFSIRLTG